MSDIIHLLPDSAASQIAAGEVIQRPASVIKELVENAVDADAQNIHVLVTGTGRTCIQIIDDGKGMPEIDTRLSFERHATSKIREAADLLALCTMGSHGEVLASIAAVAQTEPKTRLESEGLGTKLVIAGLKVESQEAASCSKGSNSSVKNLPFNVPARRKFLKTNSAELSSALAEFERIALVHPEVAFSLYSNDFELSNLPVLFLRQRTLATFGKKLNQQLLDIEVDTTMVKISGYITKPETARKKGAHQYSFVNGRYMRHPHFHKVVMEAYEQLISVSEQVSYFIYFEVSPANISVNIHPIKTEIELENEQAIWQILSAPVKESLGKFSAIPSIDFGTEDMPGTLALEQNLPPAPPKIYYNSDFDPFKVSSGGSGDGSYSRPKVEWEGLYGGLTRVSKMDEPQQELEMDWENSPFEEEPMVAEEKTISAVSAIFSIFSSASSTLYVNESVTEKGSLHPQFKGRFILTSVKSGLMLIDQHHAHIRVSSDRYMVQIKQKQGVSQGVLFPEILQLPASEAAVLQGIMDDLSAVGFDLSDLGGGSYAINSIPPGIEGLNPVELVRNMLHTAMEKGSDVKEEIQNILTLVLARAAATAYGQVLSNEEIVGLVDSLSTCPSPNYIPDGKTVLTTIREEDIEKLSK